MPATSRTTPPATRHSAPPGPASRSWSRTFAAQPAQLGQARHALAAFLNGSPLTDDATTCLSELAANAIEHSNSRHPGGTITITAALSPHGLHVTVQDQGGPWRHRASAPDSPRGRGLHIVAALASCWGKTTASAGTRTVWFTITTGPAQGDTMTTTSHPPGPDALSAEAITTDYPGWDIHHNGHWWTATCPAMHLKATTPHALRDALERALSPDDKTP